MLCARFRSYLIHSQGVEEAAYRKGFSTEDHLIVTTLLMEKAFEHNFLLWIGMVDFEKAFDEVDHAALWQVLVKQGVPR